mgnify:FL=1
MRDERIRSPSLSPYEKHHHEDAELREGQALVAHKFEVDVHRLRVEHDRRYRGHGQHQPGHIPNIGCRRIFEGAVGGGACEQDNEGIDRHQDSPVPDIDCEIVSDSCSEEGSDAERQSHDLVGVQALPLVVERPGYESERGREQESSSAPLHHAECHHHEDVLAQAQPDGASGEQGHPDQQGIARTQPVHEDSGDYDDGDFGDYVAGQKPSGDVGSGLQHDLVVRDAHIHPAESADEHAHSESGYRDQVVPTAHEHPIVSADI